MPRERKQTARFDPSPEAVASWNDTSGALRKHVDLLARVRLGLTQADEELVAKAHAAKAALVKQSKQLKPKLPAAAASRVAGKKRPRTNAGGRTAAPTAASGADAGSVAREQQALYLTGWAHLTELREAGGHEVGESQIRGNDVSNNSASRDAVPPSSTTYSSSLSPSTSGSGSDSDSDCSYASVMSRKNTLPWRRPGSSTTSAHPESVLRRTAAVNRTVAAGSGGGSSDVSASAGPASVTASDTDSEYASTGGGDNASPLSDASGESGIGSGAGVAASRGNSGVVEGEGVEGQTVEEQNRVKESRNVVSVRLAKSEMPARFAEAQPVFETCLNKVLPEDRVGPGMRDMLASGDENTESDGADRSSPTAAAQAAQDALARASAIMMALDPGDGAQSNAWLSSAFIDVVLAKFARTYPAVHFMPCEFAKLDLRSPVGSCKRSASPVTTDRSSSSAASSATASGAAGEADGQPGPPNGTDIAADEMEGDASSQASAAVSNPDRQYRDILGRPIVYSEGRPVIFLTHVNDVHWNLLRVEHKPVPELQLFEPMGKPPPRRGHHSGGGHNGDGTTRARGTGFRCIPKAVYEWLDEVWPMDEYIYSNGQDDVDAGASLAGASLSTSSASPNGNPASSGNGKRSRSNGASSTDGTGRSSKRFRSNDGGWFERAYSAITRQQQTTGFDCGVATLLYAEKCGQGQMRQDVNAWTNQADMTAYRVSLQQYVQEALSKSESPEETTSASSSSASAGVVLSPTSPQPPAEPSSFKALPAAAPTSALPSPEQERPISPHPDVIGEDTFASFFPVRPSSPAASRSSSPASVGAIYEERWGGLI